MKSFSTEFKRKKLVNAFNTESPLIFIERIDSDIDLVALSSIKKVVLFNTSLINPVDSRTTKGVQLMKQKDGSSMVKVMRAEHAKFAEPEYYRKSEGLNVIGFYLKKGDEV
jgi:DNA gyrase subunit A